MLQHIDLDNLIRRNEDFMKEIKREENNQSTTMLTMKHLAKEKANIQALKSHLYAMLDGKITIIQKASEGDIGLEVKLEIEETKHHLTYLASLLEAEKNCNDRMKLLEHRFDQSDTRLKKLQKLHKQFKEKNNEADG